MGSTNSRLAAAYCSIEEQLKAVIQSFLESGANTIVAVSGIPGVGKTTLCRALSNYFGSKVLLFKSDWFIIHPTALRIRLIEEAIKSNNQQQLTQWKNLISWFDWEEYKKSLFQLSESGTFTLANAWCQKTGEKDQHVSLELPQSQPSVILCDGAYLLHPGIAEVFDFIVLIDDSTTQSLYRAKQRDSHRVPSDYASFKLEQRVDHDTRYFLKYRSKANLIIEAPATETGV